MQMVSPSTVNERQSYESEFANCNRALTSKHRLVKMHFRVEWRENAKILFAKTNLIYSTYREWEKLI